MTAGLLALLMLAAPEPEPRIVPPTLTAPLSLPSDLGGRRDVVVRVLVALTVDVDGAPSDLEVAQSPGERWSAAALEALRRARFVPATRGGLPIAVRIVAPVVFGTVAGATRLDRRDAEATPTVASGIEGEVLERGTRRPVAGVSVLLGDRETVTDADGRFAFRDIPKGRYDVEVPLFGAEGTMREVRVPSTITLRVTPDALVEYATRVVRESGGTRDAARIRVPVERAREVAGSSGDPLKVLESLPGVARPAAAGPGAGEISVRGAGPEDTRYFIDGMPLPQLYHFGNIYSVVQDEWIDDIDFRAGGYSTEFGDALGGLVDVSLRDLPRDGVHGHGDVNIYHAAGLVTVPVSDAWTLGVALRRSWVDAILGGLVGDDVSFTTAPRYYDYQLRADYLPNDATTLRLLAFGSDDEVVVLGGGPEADDPEGRGFSLARSFQQLQGTLALTLAKDLALKFGLATSYQRLRVQPGESDLQITFDPLTWRGDLDWRPSRPVRVRAGLLGEVSRFRVEVAVPRPIKEGQVQLPSEVRETLVATEEGYAGRLDAWGEVALRVSPELELLAGTRLATWHGNFDAFAPDARLAVGWEPFESTKLTLSGGLNHQAPAPDESARSIGNPELLPERAAYLNLGVAQRFGEHFAVELQGFWKALDHLVVPAEEVPYDNAGTGTIVGGEALVRLQHPIVDAWLAYTLSRSRRVDRPGAPERFFSYDQTHVLAVVAGVRLGAGWRLGARLRYATGNPYTPLEPAYFDAGADVWVPRAAAPPLSARSEAFLQLDLRVDKTFVFDDWSLDLYLELNNATNRANIEAIRYAEDYRRRDDITSLPLTPSLGVRGRF